MFHTLPGLELLGLVGNGAWNLSQRTLELRYVEVAVEVRKVGHHKTHRLVREALEPSHRTVDLLMQSQRILNAVPNLRPGGWPLAALVRAS